MAIIPRSYYAAAEQGRQDAQNAQMNRLRIQGAQQDVDQQNILNGLMSNPNTTPEQFARAGQTGIASTLQRIQALPDEQKAEHVKQFAIQMATAAKYVDQIPVGQKKAFVEQNFPQLVQEYGPSWATDDENHIAQQIKGIGARFGTMAGIGPDKVPGESGAMYQYVDENGQPKFGTASEVKGKRPYRAPPEVSKPPPGYRPVAGGGLEPVPGGPADPNAGKGKITDTERLSAAYATRMRKAADLITTLNYVPTTADMVKFNYMLGGPGIRQSIANNTLSPEAQQYLQAVQDFNRAKLRKESGAAIGKEEVFGDLSTFFPVPGDDPATLAQKAKARETAIEGMIGAAGPAYKAEPAKAPASQKAPSNVPTFSTEAEAEAAKLKPGTRVIIGGVSGTWQ